MSRISQTKVGANVKGLVNFVLKNKLAVWLLTIIITVSGIYSGTRMKMESIPDISIPYLIVMGVYPGAAPEQVMDDVSIPLEKALEGLDDVKAVYSTSSSNVAQVQVEYEYGVDMDEKKRQLESAIDAVALPEEMEDPTIMAISINMMPVVAMSVSSDKDDIITLTEKVETNILPAIEKIDGVASATVTGQHIHEVEFTYNEAKLEEFGLTEDDVKQMIQAQDLKVPLGLFEFSEGDQAVTVDGKLTSVDALKGLLIPHDAGVVTLGELASIEVVGKVQSVSRTNGEDAISIQIVKGQQANTVTVVNAVKELMEEKKDEIDGLIIDITMDQGEPIEASVFSMVEKALFGGAIAILIILLFLRDFKSTVISFISIPVSIFMALLLLNWLDISLNLMTLGAITVAIGRVIDDSIVVVENIYRRMHLKEEKLHGRALIREATLEMFKPILSSTLVTVAVFAPLIFVGGMVGELFMPFALTMTFALGASLIVAITIVPALSHTLFKNKIYGEKKESNHKEAGKLAVWYRGILEKCLNHKWITSIVSIVLLAGSIALMPFIGFSFMGSSVEKSLYLTYTPKTGELMSVTEENIAEVENYLLTEYKDEIETIQLSINNPENADPAQMMMAGSGSLMFVMFKDDVSTDDYLEMKDVIFEKVEAMPAEDEGVWKNQDFANMGMSSNEISYTLFSEDLDDLLQSVRAYEAALADVEGLDEVTSDAEDPYVEHVIKVDQANVLQYGLTTGQILMALTANDTRDVLTTVEYEDQDINVVVQREARKAATNIDELLETPLMTAQGPKVLGDVVTVEEGTTLNSLARNKGEYYATVSATIVGDDISKPQANADEAIADVELPDGVTQQVAGVTADMEETFSQLGVAMIAAIAIVYFILVVTFGEGLAPFAILFSLPFTVIGSFVGLFITDQTISVNVMMGLLMLIGIVVTNAIVLVDRIVKMEHAGMSIREAILEAGATRLRPILMTAIATIGAMVPMAFADPTVGSLISKDLAVTVIGGLITSTILTLVIVPIVYELLSKLLKKDRKNQRHD